MAYEEAINVLQEYLDTYIPPADIEMDEACSVAILALQRCIYMDEQYERKERKKNENAN